MKKMKRLKKSTEETTNTKKNVSPTPSYTVEDGVTPFRNARRSNVPIEVLERIILNNLQEQNGRLNMGVDEAGDSLRSNS
jgi:hypothetical protein